MIVFLVADIMSLNVSVLLAYSNTAHYHNNWTNMR